jgi:magnesium transporter
MRAGKRPRGRGRDLDIARATAGQEIRRRVPWIGLALVAGVAMVLVGKQFEEALSRRVELAFFLPMIVYLSDCIGTETLALFVRALAARDLALSAVVRRELAVGLALGLAGGIPMGLFAYLWLGDPRLAMALVAAMVANGAIAVLTGVLVPVAFARAGRDPAIGTDELTTALSDTASLLAYFAVATLVVAPAA